MYIHTQKNLLHTHNEIEQKNYIYIHLCHKGEIHSFFFFYKELHSKNLDLNLLKKQGWVGDVRRNFQVGKES